MYTIADARTGVLLAVEPAMGKDDGAFASSLPFGAKFKEKIPPYVCRLVKAARLHEGELHRKLLADSRFTSLALFFELRCLNLFPCIMAKRQPRGCPLTAFKEKLNRADGEREPQLGDVLCRTGVLSRDGQQHPVALVGEHDSDYTVAFITSYGSLEASNKVKIQTNSTQI